MDVSKETINQDLKEAMRARDKKRLETLRLIMAAVKQIEVDERIEVDSKGLVAILNKLAKQRRESITQYQKAERQDLVDQEQFELDIIQNYLPELLSEQEILAVIEQAISDTQASSIKDMGGVMAVVKPKLLGRADMAQVSALVKQKLS